MKKQTSRLSSEESKLLTKVMTMGLGTNLPVMMSESELAKLIGVIYHDTDCGDELKELNPKLWEKIAPNADYYELPEEWFLSPIDLEPEQHVALMKIGENQIEDFTTYLRCLSELHKRRRKYQKILSAQPMPTMIQVSPRSLVEYGTTEPEALASWLTWRKFFYDLDNRSAQETGYLFEPILAAAIGGEQKSARTRVVTRSGDPTKGRQVDCWKVLPNGATLAYEFKLRVTIAASGQGRFGEEIQFAEDAYNSGATPILIVLDPTMNPRLEVLQKAFEAKGGRAYLGEDAWEHLEEQAGEVMSRFIEKYVRRPIEEISRFESTSTTDENRKEIKLLDFHASYQKNRILFQLGNNHRVISRHEDPSLSGDDEEEIQNEI
ncbi:restriction endonuclease [Pseudomonas sp. KBS0710]|uniref:restriction endonuclease n=1 Tax=Pseudomonas sp. KBS0710 TaxID=1179667 RepID=UPI00110E3BB4|nr:restriction endonuclease [Pseudomonas sp. KBS0710]TSD68632.1 restriction endonuclease [Pseudomonas sp. KBS0710]